MPKIIRDESTTSSYWAAVNTLGALPDVHIIADAPIGCYNLVGVAVIDYTDAIPYLRNFTPTDLTEKAISTSGTASITKETIEKLRGTGKTLIVMSTAESEMVGADHTQMLAAHYPDIKFFPSNSLLEDEWQGRDRVLAWCFDNYDDGKPASVEKGTVSIIGPTYGCFNSPSDLAEVKRLIQGAGGTVKKVFPMESRLADISELKHSDVIVVMYEEFGKSLAEKLNRPILYAPFGLYATEQFIRDLGKLLGTSDQAERFIKQEKHTTLKLIWDLWRGPQSEWFPTVNFAVCATRTYAKGLKTLLADELGMTCVFAEESAKADNTEIRRRLHEAPPQIMFGRIVDKMYLAEVNAKTYFIQSAYPGPFVRRALGTPYMGFSGATYLVQEIVNILYDVLFQFLPSHKQGAEFVQPDKKFIWTKEASEMLAERTRRAPFISQISFSRELKTKAELYAQKHGLDTITPEILAQIS
ncbi:MAG: chlorophyllide a reductase subunit Z [Chloroherpetonaceae bacterium]|nr:chlorophyllide a reductase subunit Z [Chloroherpetonaceae bacterium]